LPGIDQWGANDLEVLHVARRDRHPFAFGNRRNLISAMTVLVRYKLPLGCRANQAPTR
jgi:hypothetical protein